VVDSDPSDFDAWRVRLGARVRQMREARDLTQEGCEMAGVSVHTLQSIERGKTDAKVSTLWKLARLFGVTLGDLLEELE
jgi:transcriptional regulator with XRE-family HTH domain